MLRSAIIVSTANKMAFRIRTLLFACLFGHALTFSHNENTAFYSQYVDQYGGMSPISCTCPSDSNFVCNCKQNGILYFLEAPFAAMLVEPVAPTPINWPPTTHFQIHKSLPNLTGQEEIINHLKVWPRNIFEIGARFKFFIKSNNVISSSFSLHYSDLSNWESKVTIEQDSLFVLIHGWTGSDVDLDVSSMTAYLLMQNSVVNGAAITVNWNRGATGLYRQSAAETVVIGKEVGLLLFELVKSGMVDPRVIHLIGFDMGSHIATIAAATYGQLADRFNLNSITLKPGANIGRRTGLNPLSRHFYRVLEPDVIHDATFVDIIHTSTSQSNFIGGNDIDILNRRYGISSLNDPDDLLSQVDFYPNSGESGKECKIHDYGCGLNLAVSYFKSSLTNNVNRTAFISYPCDSIGNLEDCQRQPHAPSGVMGIDAPSGNPSGNQFLHFSLPVNKIFVDGTNSISPRCSRTSSHEAARQSIQYQADHPGCGLYMDDNEPMRILQGHPAEELQFPWAVCIITLPVLYEFEDFFNGKSLNTFVKTYERAVEDTLDLDSKSRALQSPWVKTCSASLLDENWVITAAHCFGRVKNGIPVYLVFNALNCFDPPAPHADHVRRVVVEKRDHPDQTVFIHPSFSFPVLPRDLQGSGDIALVRLHKPVAIKPGTGITPICYQESANYGYEDCQRVTVAAYGKKGPIDDSTLTWMSSRVVDQDAPHHVVSDESEYGLNPSIILGAQRENYFGIGNFERQEHPYITGRAICPGDSGGPIMKLEDSVATLVGTLQSAKLNQKRECDEMKKHMKRSEYDPSYHGDQMIYRIPVSVGVKVGKYLSWINEVIATKTGNAEPNDRFNSPAAGRLGQSPSFGEGVGLQPTIPPHQPGEDILG